MTVIDQETMQSIGAILIVVIPIIVAYLKKVLNLKKESESQADIVLEGADMELERLIGKYPENEDLKTFRITLLKARAIWNDPDTAEDEMNDLFGVKEVKYVRVLKKTGE